MANNPQNDFKKEIEEELARSLAKQKLIDIKLNLKGNLSGQAQKEIDGLLTKNQETLRYRSGQARDQEQGAMSAEPEDETGESRPDSLAPSTGDKGGQKKSGDFGAKDNQPAAKKSAATKKEEQQSAAEKELQAASGENQPNQPGPEQKPPAGEKPGIAGQPQEENQQPPPVATKPEAAQGQTSGLAAEAVEPPTPKSPAQGLPAVSPPANPNILKRAWQAMRQKPAGQIGQPLVQGLGESSLTNQPIAPAGQEGTKEGGGKETAAARTPRQYQTDLDKKKKEAKAKEEAVKAEAFGPAEIEGKLKKLKQIYRIINGTSALTLWGIIVTFLVMNTQLVFANMSPIAALFKIPLPKLDLWEIGLLMLVDLVIGAFIFFLIIVIYFIVDCTGGILGSKMLWCWVKL